MGKKKVEEVAVTEAAPQSVTVNRVSNGYVLSVTKDAYTAVPVILVAADTDALVDIIVDLFGYDSWKD